MMRKTILAPALAFTVLAACGQQDPTGKAAEDAHDVAMVERMSKEPFKPIIPKPITEIDVARYGLDKPGCAFRKLGQDDPIFIANRDEGFLRVAGELKRYAAKVESAQLPGNARSTYVGLASWVDLVSLPDEKGGSNSLHWPAKLIVHDAQERVAFMAEGEVACKGG